MKFSQKLFINSKYLSEDFIKRLCFLNNVKSKYFIVGLIICSVTFSFYDISILQKITKYNIFLAHFKTDIVFLVFSFIFALYIFFNQVKTHKHIQHHHKYVHGIISLFILSWSVLKSIILIKYNNGNFNIAIISILLSSFLYIFPFIVYLAQLLFTLVFALIISLLFNFTINEIANDILFILIISCISIIISRYVFYLQFKIFTKESEAISYRKKLNSDIEQ